MILVLLGFLASLATQPTVCATNFAAEMSAIGPELLKKTIELRKERSLELLGIPQGDLPNNLTVPQYMLDLHRLLSQTNDTSENETEQSTRSGAEADVEKASRVDTVHSLINKDERHELSHLKQQLQFQMPAIPSEKDVTSAELRLFRDVPVTGSVQDASGEVIAHATISQIIKRPGTQQYQRVTLDRVDLFNVPGSRWVIFDVTDAARDWVKSPEKNLGLELRTHYTNDTKVNPSTIGLKKFPNDPVKEALMVVFSNEEQIDAKLLSRTKRGTFDNMLGFPLGWTRDDLQRKDSICKRHEFYIDFRVLRWNIIAPRGYRAYYCSGMCPSTLTNNMNASNHARIQSLMHHLRPDDYPSVACVPVRLSPIMVLLRNKDGIITIRKIRDMVAGACGCQ